MFPTFLHILLADDDYDDCSFFQEALIELSVPNILTCVHDGVGLLNYLLITNILPDVIFLDLNMPLKNGIECLTEIRADQRFSSIPVVVCSTSLTNEIILKIDNLGVVHSFRKPSDFGMIKEAILESLFEAFRSQTTF